MLIQDLKYTEQTDTFLPTMYDLPSEDPKEPGVPDFFHMCQPELLSKTFCPPGYKSDRIMFASDVNLYYDLAHPLWYKRPDWYAVLDVPLLYDERDLRLSYVVWDEKVIPSIVIEFLSIGDRKEDLGEAVRKSDEPPTKWEVYEQILGIPWYAVFDHYTDKLRVFKLVDSVKGQRKYCEIALPKQRIWLSGLEIGLGLWNGEHYGLERNWLRWYDKNGEWIPTPEEQRADKEKQRADKADKRSEKERQRADKADKRSEKERQRADKADKRSEKERQRADEADKRSEKERQLAKKERQRADKLTAKLKELGISLDDI